MSPQRLRAPGLTARVLALCLCTGCSVQEADAGDSAQKPDDVASEDAAATSDAVAPAMDDADASVSDAMLADATQADATLDATSHVAPDATPDAAPDASKDAGSVDAGPPAPVAADVAYDAFTKLFYTVTNGKGYYVNNSGTATADAWWTQAELIEMAIDAYERNPSPAYRSLMTELIAGFVAKQGSDWTYNDFNDDIAWMVI
ncbi:MAG TPA: hypothetical protein VJU61_13725, partial [Polyangiaceae bacterium]|nr:hypothetical protein [Polyangiaceae bacterium]